MKGSRRRAGAGCHTCEIIPFPNRRPTLPPWHGAADRIDLNEALSPRGSDVAAMHVAGESLGVVSEGDLILVDRNARPARGSLVVVTGGGALAVKFHEDAAPGEPLFGVVRFVIKDLRAGEGGAK